MTLRKLNHGDRFKRKGEKTEYEVVGYAPSGLFATRFVTVVGKDNLQSMSCNAKVEKIEPQKIKAQDTTTVKPKK